MADVSTEPAFAISAEDAVLLDNDNPHAAAAVGDDIDFDLGGVETHDYADLTTGGDVDDIGYEEDTTEADAAVAVADSAEGAHSPVDEALETNADGTGEANEDVDEIDYEDVGGLTTHDGPDDNGVEGKQLDEGYEQQVPETVSDEAELDFELNGGANVASEKDGSDVKEAPQENDFEEAGSANDGNEGVEEEDAEEEEAAEGSNVEVEEDEDDAENADAAAENEDGSVGADMQMHSEMDHDGSEAANQAYDDADNDEEDAAEDDDDEQEGGEADGLSGSLDTGLGLLGNLHPGSSFDVTVTWGDQVCPLFKVPGVDDPDMFYLEDAEALNYPLSRFLQTVRSSIASWVNSSDEIFIRVDDLGLEFGETTTEALLNQVTFHNLLALHNTLSKNDDSEAPKGVHITLGTRPNCLLRLRDLVTGAGLGKGLSVFQKQAQSDSDESSEDSGENEAGSSNLPPDVEETQDDYSVLSENDGDAFAPEDEGGDTEMTGTSVGITAANAGLETSAEGEEERYEEADDDEVEEVAASEPANEDTGLDAPAEADVLAVGQEETDYVAFANEEDGVDATPGAISVAPGASNGSTLKPETEQGGAPSGVDDLLDEAATDANNHHDDLDVWGDFEPSGTDDLGQPNGEDQEEADRLQPANGPEHEPQQNGPIEDGPLNVGSNDADASGMLADENAPQLGEDKITTDDLDIALDSSATATLDHDEIDYEDNHAATGASDSVNDTVPDPGADEIDWDDEIKNGTSDATTPLQTISGKRSREADESGDALLDDSPDPKRQRAEDSSL